MKRYSLISFVLVLALVLVACSPEATPEETVEKALEELKNNNIENFQKYIVDADSFSDEEIDESIEYLVKNLEVEVKSSSIDGDTATVETDITNINFSIVMEEFLSQAMGIAMENALSEDPMSQEEMDSYVEELLITILERDEIETVTTTANISLEKTNGQWKIIYDEEIQNALFFGIADFAE